MSLILSIYMSGSARKVYGIEFKLSVVSRTEGNSIQKVAGEAGGDERRVREWKNAS